MLFVGRSAADDQADCPSSREQKQQTGVEIMPGSTHHQVLIVGECRHNRVAILKRRAVGISLAIVEPEHDHYYSTGFHVGWCWCLILRPPRAAQNKKPDTLPPPVDFATRPRLLSAEKHGSPQERRYANPHYLVVCTGVKLDWGNIVGSRRPSARMGCAATTSPDTAPHTTRGYCLQRPEVRSPGRCSLSRRSHLNAPALKMIGG